MEGNQGQQGKKTAFVVLRISTSVTDLCQEAREPHILLTPEYLKHDQ